MSRVEIFTKEQFEQQALPVHNTTGQPLWQYIGIRGGEHAYLIKLPKFDVGIEVRSSVRADGASAATGEDSIRCWLVDLLDEGKPMGSKITRWTTRLPGWGERTKAVLRQLWTMGNKIQLCPTCKVGDTRLRCYKVKKDGPNKGRLFLRCPQEGCKHFAWADIAENGEVKAEEPKSKNGEVLREPCPLCGGIVKSWFPRKEDEKKGKWFHSCCGDNDGVTLGCGYFKWVQ